MDTHGDPHLRRIPDRFPYPNCPNPVGQGPQGRVGRRELLGKDRVRWGRFTRLMANTTKVYWDTPDGVDLMSESMPSTYSSLQSLGFLFRSNLCNTLATTSPGWS
ncbi:hypothetical protein ElyMa_006605200 [Elysia marginata]|uniref:Uncharacterized protein n=1 Tax=Elysia marginata TaxID=1093978 RepID=A0AAV4IE15_9GAST|nr:hypothetical protein ElyMa_006605200 [Elysia marginata]